MTCPDAPTFVMLTVAVVALLVAVIALAASVHRHDRGPTSHTPHRKDQP